MTHRTKSILTKVYLYSILLFASLSLMVFAYWSFYPYKTIEHYPDSYALGKTTLKQGETTFYEFNYCKFSDAPVTLYKQFIDGIVYEAPVYPAFLQVGCGSAKIDITIPVNLPPGEYYLKVEANYKVNPIRTITETNITQKFTVTRASEGAYGDETNEYIH
jgi:hypothetical protein